MAPLGSDPLRHPSDSLHRRPQDPTTRSITDVSRDNDDSPWKGTLERYSPEFLALLFPRMYAAIDGSKGHAFLDNELQQVMRDAEAETLLQWSTRMLSARIREQVFATSEPDPCGSDFSPTPPRDPCRSDFSPTPPRDPCGSDFSPTPPRDPRGSDFSPTPPSPHATPYRTKVRPTRFGHLRIVRPGHGLAPKHSETLLSRAVKKDLAMGTALSWDLIG